MHLIKVRRGRTQEQPPTQSATSFKPTTPRLPSSPTRKAHVMAKINPQQQQLSLRHGIPGTVYVLHFEPAYKHARHYIGWTASTDITDRLNIHLQGRGSPLIRAAVSAGVEIQLAETYQGTRYLGRRLKRRHKTSQFCAICRAHRGGHAHQHEGGTGHDRLPLPLRGAGDTCLPTSGGGDAIGEGRWRS